MMANRDQSYRTSLETYVRGDNEIIFASLEALLKWVLRDVKSLVLDPRVIFETFLCLDEESGGNVGKCVLVVQALAVIGFEI